MVSGRFLRSASARRAASRVAAALILVPFLLLPDGATSVLGQDQTAEEEREEVRERQGEVAIEVDALEAEHEEISGALDALARNVEVQEAELEEAERAAQAAEEDLAEAERSVEQAERRIEDLGEATDELMVASYVNPPTESMFSAFSSENISDAAVKRVLLDLRSNTDADLFDQLSEAHEDLQLEREHRAEIAVEADQKRATAASALGELETALDQQGTFADEAEEALERKLAEAASLAERDQELSEQIAAEQAELARQLEAARRAAEEREREQEQEQESAAPAQSSSDSEDAASPSTASPAPGGPSTVSPAPGGLSTVSCPVGGAITVAGSIGPSLQGLLEAADASGIRLCGWGFRDPEQQIQLRRQHCGSSDYAVWHMPASQCSPPTARPGRSMHERGLAVDFTCDGGSIGTRSNRCFQWLAENAASYGLHNLPSEPWHWSTTGG